MFFVKLLFVILSVLIVSVFSRNTDPTLPGSGIMQVGFDLSKLDLFPTDSEKSDGRAKKYLFDFTFNEGKYFLHPGIQKNFRVPDQFGSIDTEPAGNLQFSMSFEKTVDKKVNSWGEHAGVSGGFDGISGSASESYQETTKSMVEESRMSIELKGDLKSHYIMLKTGDVLEPSEGFKKDLAKITGTYEDNPDAYDKFLNDYGTHYFTMAHFGGCVVYRFELKISYAKTETESSLQAEAKGGVKELGSFDAGAFTNNSKSSVNLKKNSNIFLKFFGGEIYVPSKGLDEDKVKEWQRKVESNPWQISGQNNPIYDLVKDEDIKYELKNAMYSKFHRQMLIVVDTILNGLLNAKKIDDTETFYACNCNVSVIRYHIARNAGLRVPVRQEVFDLQAGILKLAKDRTDFAYMKEPTN